MADDYRPAWFLKLHPTRQVQLEEVDPYKVDGWSDHLPLWQSPRTDPQVELLIRIIELLESR